METMAAALLMTGHPDARDKVPIIYPLSRFLHLHSEIIVLPNLVVYDSTVQYTHHVSCIVTISITIINAILSTALC